MTPEERAAIEARDERSYWASEKFYTGVEWRVITDRHALLDELRRVEQQRARAMALIRGLANTEWFVKYAELKAEIDGEKEEPTP